MTLSDAIGTIMTKYRYNDRGTHMYTYAWDMPTVESLLQLQVIFFSPIFYYYRAFFHINLIRIFFFNLETKIERALPAFWQTSTFWYSFHRRHRDRGRYDLFQHSLRWFTVTSFQFPDQIPNSCFHFQKLWIGLCRNYRNLT